MHSSQPVTEQGLARSATKFALSGKTGAYWHHRNTRQHPRRAGPGCLDLVARNPFIDIPKSASARDGRTLARACLRQL